MTKEKLAMLLLRRKELEGKVKQLKEVKEQDFVELRTRRVKVSEGIDEVTAGIPKVKMADITAEYDYYAKALRICDAAIQQTNWITEVEIDDCVLEPYIHPKEED